MPEFFVSEEEKIAIVDYLCGELTGFEPEILHNWLEKNPKNKQLIQDFEEIWETSSYRAAEKHIAVNRAWKELQSRIDQKKGKSDSWQKFLQFAAIVLIAIFLGGVCSYFFFPKTEITEPQFVEYLAPLGSRSFVKLADGSKVWLNAGSRLKYSNTFGNNNRLLSLDGEAFFEVTKNENLPFVVKTSEIDVVALGTKFNVKAYSEEQTIETTLIEGSVKLESKTVNFSEKIFLKPFEKAVFTKKNHLLTISKNQPRQDVQPKPKPKLEIIESIDPEPIVSWKNKRWVIANEKLGNLALKLERRYDVNFIFDNDVLKEYSFRGTLEDETLEQIMEAIKLSAPIKYVIDNKTVYVMADGQKMNKFKNLMMK